MTPGLRFSVLSGWAPRDQGPGDVAKCWLQMIQRLQNLNPAFRQWYICDKDGGFEPLILSWTEVTRAIAEAVGKHEDGEEDPRLGYRFNAFNCPRMAKRPTDFKITTTADPLSKYAGNGISLSTPYGVVPDPALVTFDIMKEVVLAQSEAFQATSGGAWQDKLADFWQRGGNCPELPIYWISYIGAAYAHLVNPPTSALVEWRPDGGLLMAATDEIFNVDNPSHMVVARDIEAAVAPFNALPRPLGPWTFDESGRPIRA